MKNKILVVLMILLSLSMIGTLNYTTSALVGSGTKGGINFFWRGQNVRVTSSWANFGGTVSLYCTNNADGGTTEDYSSCQQNGSNQQITSGCTFFALNDTTSPVVSTNTVTTLTGANRYYCQLCNTTGFCDNSTLVAGGNSGYFRITNGSAFTTALIMIGTALLTGAFLYAYFDSKKLQFSKDMVGIALLISLAGIIISMLMYGF